MTSQQAAAGLPLYPRTPTPRWLSSSRCSWRAGSVHGSDVTATREALTRRTRHDGSLDESADLIISGWPFPRAHLSPARHYAAVTGEPCQPAYDPPSCPHGPWWPGSHGAFAGSRQHALPRQRGPRPALAPAHAHGDHPAGSREPLVRRRRPRRALETTEGEPYSVEVPDDGSEVRLRRISPHQGWAVGRAHGADDREEEATAPAPPAGATTPVRYGTLGLSQTRVMARTSCGPVSPRSAAVATLDTMDPGPRPTNAEMAQLVALLEDAGARRGLRRRAGTALNEPVAGCRRVDSPSRSRRASSRSRPFGTPAGPAVVARPAPRPRRRPSPPSPRAGRSLRCRGRSSWRRAPPRRSRSPMPRRAWRPRGPPAQSAVAVAAWAARSAVAATRSACFRARRASPRARSASCRFSSASDIVAERSPSLSPGE